MDQASSMPDGLARANCSRSDKHLLPGEKALEMIVHNPNYYRCISPARSAVLKASIMKEKFKDFCCTISPIIFLEEHFK